MDKVITLVFAFIVKQTVFNESQITKGSTTCICDLVLQFGDLNYLCSSLSFWCFC